MLHLPLRVLLALHDQKSSHPMVTHQSVEYDVLIKLKKRILRRASTEVTKYIYLPVPRMKNGAISTAENQSTTIGNRMGDTDWFYFERPSSESLLCSKYLKPRWNNDPKLLQTFLNKLF